LGFLFFHWITFVTNHGEEITVPNLRKMTPEQAETVLDELDLDFPLPLTFRTWDFGFMVY
jgi:hypothetical protein